MTHIRYLPPVTPAAVPSLFWAAAKTAGLIGLLWLVAGCEPYVNLSAEAGTEYGKTNDASAVDATFD